MTRTEFLEVVKQALAQHALTYDRSEANWWLTLSTLTDEKYNEFFGRK